MGRRYKSVQWNNDRKPRREKKIPREAVSPALENYHVIIEHLRVVYNDLRDISCSLGLNSDDFPRKHRVISLEASNSQVNIYDLRNATREEISIIRLYSANLRFDAEAGRKECAGLKTALESMTNIYGVDPEEFRADNWKGKKEGGQ